MIIYFFHFCVGLSLLLLQTTVISSCVTSLGFFNLLNLYILFCCLFRPVAEGLPVAIILGLFFDSLSGAPFGLYMTVFLWLFVFGKWSAQYFHTGSILLLPLIAGCAILFENVFVITAMIVLGREWHFPILMVKSALIQIAWGILFGAPFLLVMNLLYQKLDDWLEVLAINRKELRG